MKVALVRHAEATANASGLALGRKDVPLTERGRLQAAALATAFDGWRIDAIVSSPLRRALDTAGPLAARFGLEVEVAPGFVEMDVGETDGLTFADLRARYPEFLERWLSDDCADVPMPGGETLRQVQDRAWAEIERLYERFADGAVLVVTHNFVIGALLCAVTGAPLSRFRRFRQGLASRSLIDVRPGARTLLALNDTAHLRAAGLGSDPW